MDATYDYATSRDYLFKEHCLVWGHSSGEPSWVCGLSQSEQREEVEEWFSAFSNRYSPDLCDVVNEPLHDPPCYTSALGGSGSSGWDWAQWCYQNYSGGTKIVNDYNLLSSSSNASQIASVKSAVGASAVGCEAHSLESVSSSTISSCFSTIGGTIYVSELDIRGSDSEQLSRYQSIFPTLQSHSSGTTLWGYVQGTMWRSDAYLITSSGSRRPAMDWLCDNYLNCSGGTTSTTTTTSASTTTTSASTTTTTTSATTTTSGGGGDTCSPVDSEISPGFTQNGAGEYCWTATSCSYINSWNLQSLTINGVDFTNSWANGYSLPAKIDGKWYISYDGNYGWSHFELR